LCAFNILRTTAIYHSIAYVIDLQTGFKMNVSFHILLMLESLAHMWLSVIRW